jgi:hypothetical protein
MRLCVVRCSSKLHCAAGALQQTTVLATRQLYAQLRIHHIFADAQTDTCKVRLKYQY